MLFYPFGKLPKGEDRMANSVVPDQTAPLSDIFELTVHIKGNMSHIMGKPVYAIYKQQRCRSACVSASLISTFVVRCLDSIISLVSISEFQASS